MIENKKIKTNDNTFISAVIYEPKKIKKAVILTHGFSLDKEGPSSLFIALAKNLYKKNYFVIRFDFRNFGTKKGFNLAKSFDDLKTITNYTKQYSSDIIFLGHSISGLLDLVFAQKEKSVKAIVLWSVPFNLPLPKNLRKYIIAPWEGLVLLTKSLFSKQVIHTEEYLKRIKFPILFKILPNQAVFVFCPLSK